MGLALLSLKFLLIFVRDVSKVRFDIGQSSSKLLSFKLMGPRDAAFSPLQLEIISTTQMDNVCHLYPASLWGLDAKFPSRILKLL